MDNLGGWAGLVLTLAIFGVAQIIRVIRDEGEKTRRLLASILCERNEFVHGEPTLADRVKWIQWKLNPKPFE